MNNRSRRDVKSGTHQLKPQPSVAVAEERSRICAHPRTGLSVQIVGPAPLPHYETPWMNPDGARSLAEDWAATGFYTAVTIHTQRRVKGRWRHVHREEVAPRPLDSRKLEQEVRALIAGLDLSGIQTLIRLADERAELLSLVAARRTGLEIPVEFELN